MLLSEMVRKIKSEGRIASATSDPISLSILSGGPHSTTSTTFVLVRTDTFTPPQNHKFYLGTIDYSLRSNGGTAYLRITVQVGSGGEETLIEDSYTGTGNKVEYRWILRFFPLNTTVTIRWYLRSSSSSYTATVESIYIRYTYTPDNLLSLANFNFAFNKPTVLFYEVSITFSSTGQYGAVYVYINNVCVDGGVFGGGTTASFNGLAGVDAGNNIVSVNGCFLASSGSMTVSVSIGIIEFSDAIILSPRVLASSLTVNPPARRTCIGPLNEYIFEITITARTPLEVTNISSGANYVKLLINSNEPSYDVIRNPATLTMAVADLPAVAKARVPLKALVNHTINVMRTNANTIATINYVASPWLLSNTEHSPVSPSFPQGSTLYLVLEPLTANPTKTIRLGKRRAKSFGDATDFYSTASGTNILSWNYTFETLEVEQAVLLVSGAGGCISIIGVDVRT